MSNYDTIQIVHWPHPALTQVAEEVDPHDMAIHELVRRMIQLVNETPNGVGLAANQVGLPLRVFVGPMPGTDELVGFINPEIEETAEGLECGVEGCLSMPGVQGPVNRPRWVTMSAAVLVPTVGVIARRFKQQDGFTARVWQHEIDHLNGICLNTTMLPKARKKARGRIQELEKAAKEGATA